MKISLIIILILWSSIGYGQFRRKDPPPPMESDTLSLFGRVSNTSLSTRLKNYPFNKSTEIKLVSFNYDGGPFDDNAYINPIMPKGKFLAICRFPFKEIKSINSAQMEGLTDILFNYGYIKEPTIEEITKCYIPRNGILFLNEKGKVFEFIEICFACKKVVYSYHDKADADDFERPKFKLLRDFFIKNKIEYGITKMFDGQTMGNWDDD